MTHAVCYDTWRDQITYGADGPQPRVLMADEKSKVIMAGLEPGQRIPEHAEAAAIYHFLEGRGTMIVDGEPHPVAAGATIVMPAGTVRGVVAETRLAFLAVRIAEAAA